MVWDTLIQPLVMAIFEEMWCQSELPRASMAARESTRTGVLTVTPTAVEFRDSRGTIQLDPVLKVSSGRRGSDFFNRWIEVEFGLRESPSTVFLNDGGWRGWRPILTRSNRRVASELTSLVH